MTVPDVLNAELVACTMDGAVSALQCPDLFRLSFLRGSHATSTGVVVLSIDAGRCRSGVTATLKMRVRKTQVEIAVQYAVMCGDRSGSHSYHAASTGGSQLYAETEAGAAWKAHIEAFIIKGLELAYLHDQLEH